MEALEQVGVKPSNIQRFDEFVVVKPHIFFDALNIIVEFVDNWFDSWPINGGYVSAKISAVTEPSLLLPTAVSRGSVEQLLEILRLVNRFAHCSVLEAAVVLSCCGTV